MNEDFLNNDILKEIKTLVDKADEVQEDIDNYCAFMKQMFLSNSGIN